MSAAHVLAQHIASTLQQRPSPVPVRAPKPQRAVHSTIKQTGGAAAPTPVRPAAPRPRPQASPQPVRPRAQRQGSNPLYDPLAPLSGHALKSAIQAAVRAEIQPQTSALDQQAADAKAAYELTSGRASDYYKQFADSARGDIATTQGIANQNVGAQQGIDARAAASLAGTRAGLQGELANDSAVRGTTAGYGTDELMSALASRQADLAQRSQADETAANSRGAAFEGYAGRMPGVAEMKGGETLHAFGNAYQKNAGDISAKEAAVRASAGPLFQKLLAGERANQFNNDVTLGGLNLKRADLQATVANNNAKVGLARSGQRQSARLAHERIATARRGQDLQHGASEDRIAATIRGQDIAHGDRSAKLALDRANAGSGGTAGLTPAQRLAHQQAAQKQMDRVGTVASKIKGMIAASRAQGKAPNHNDINQLLLSGGYQQWEIDAAVDARHHNGLYGPSTVAVFAKHGVTIPRTWQYGASQGHLGGLTH